MLNFKGLATGIGSLPHNDVNAALDLIFQYTPRVPFWPQLPKRDIREGMVAQFSQNLPCLKVDGKGLVFDPADKDKKLELFYERLLANDLDYFKITEPFALGLHRFYQRLETLDFQEVEFIKGQVTGPFTFCASLNYEDGQPLLFNSVFRQAFLKGLAMKAAWQVNFFKKFAKEIILFIDEPYLAAFGSAYTSLNRAEVVEALAEFTAGIKSPGVLLGVHCCGNTDWSIFTEVDNLDIISFDAFSYLERLVLYADALKGFLNKGGIIAWGLVPTQLFTGEEKVDLLIRRLKEGIEALTNKGIEADLLWRNLLITPSCGLGTFTPEKSEKVFRLLAETSEFLQK
jgi:methionine synthase II (cobalamin-independent)